MKYTLCADEIFIQTILWNSPFRERMHCTNNANTGSMREIDWEHGSPYIWQDHDYQTLINSNKNICTEIQFKPDGNCLQDSKIIFKTSSQMNILFYTTNEVAPQYGGVERVTANIANALTTFYNVNCYSAYKYNIDKSFIKQQFVNTIKINSYHNLNNLIQFIEQNKIDVIINQGEHKLTKSLRLALNQSQNKKCKLMFALHVSPATEINFITLDNPKKELKEGKNN